MRVIAVCLYLVLGCHGLLAQEKQQRIDSLLNALHAQGLFNGVALVSDSGEVMLHQVYGVADRANERPLSLTDRFYIGSLTKQFTAVLILQLYEDGLLDIHQPVSSYLQELRITDIAKCTVHQLLTHTSGIGNYTADPNFDKAMDYSVKEMFQFIDGPLLFEPGTDWSYSNSGYYLLAKIAERVAGNTYGGLLRENIFKPLGMNSSGYEETWITKDLAKGYWRTVDGFQPRPAYALSTLLSSGGMYSTAADLFKWDQALYTNILLSDSAKQILFNPVTHDYACGWYVKRGTDEHGNEYERHFHGGWIKGYHAFILRRIPQKQVVILLDNSYSQEIQTIKNRIWSVLVNEKVKPIKPKFSNQLFEACSNRVLSNLIDSVSDSLSWYQAQFEFEEYDINTVGYRLMEAARFEEAGILLEFNARLYPNSWNVYDSLAELRLKEGNIEEAKRLYEHSLELNHKNTSALNALSTISQKHE